MKKATVTIPYDEEKLAAARLYMEQKDLSFEEEMEKAADALYSKHVPAGVREFIELNTGNKTVAVKPKKPKAVPSSAVGAPGRTDGDSV